MLALGCGLGCGAQPHDVLLVVVDDIGTDSLSIYPEANALGAWPRTPTIERLAARGVVFDSVWADPTCSPTRATILTGRYGPRSGVEELVSRTGGTPLPLSELTLPTALARIGSPKIATAAFGKWHLANPSNGGEHHPNMAGFSHFAGLMNNLTGNDSFFQWPKVVDGQVTRSRSYLTSDTIDDASRWIRRQPGSWLVYLSLHAAHWPWQVPPHALLPQQEPGESRPPAATACLAACRRWMIEAMDRELGRLLDEIDPDLESTTVILVSDNGTPAPVRPDGSAYASATESNHFKGTLYEGGIHVPLVVSGAGVARPGRRYGGLVNTTDLFATSLELATGRSASAIAPDVTLDSRSLLPILDGDDRSIRSHAFATGGNGTYAIRDERYKLIRRVHRDALHDLGDPVERYREAYDLLAGAPDGAARAAHERLGRRLDALLAEMKAERDAR